MVPLSQRNITASARHIVGTIQLSPDDLCLNIMPLFHIHGLMAAVLSTLAAGAEVWCSPGFNPLKFFGWLDDVRPSWYTAVPTMHQTILTRAERNPDAIERSRLRLIRSSSASLPSTVMGQLEETFRAPVIESYGHDRSVAPDGVEPAAAARAQTGIGRRGRRTRGRCDG
jgi:acyl-CoA synthetase (AMP-forming)/AMP-acid ligase II